LNTHFRVAGRLAHKLEELEVQVSAVLRRAGLPQNLFHQMRVLVTTQELFAVWRAISEVSADPAIGLKLGNPAFGGRRTARSRFRRKEFTSAGPATPGVVVFGQALSNKKTHFQVREVSKDKHCKHVD
jgi:hypothetical protein